MVDIPHWDSFRPDWYEHMPDEQWLRSEEQGCQEGEEIWRALDLQPGIRVFDCPCGDARVSVELAKRGASVHGVDINPRFVARAQQRFQELGLDGSFSQGDMREASLPGGCDLLLNWFNSFGYFGEADNRRTMAAFAAALRPGGRLVLESPNIDHLLQNVAHKTDSDGHDAPIVWDAEKGQAFLYYPPTDKEEEILGAFRLYSPDEFRTLFEEAGLKLEAKYSESFTKFSPDSKRFILVARKNTRID